LCWGPNNRLAVVSSNGRCIFILNPYKEEKDVFTLQSYDDDDFDSKICCLSWCTNPGDQQLLAVGYENGATAIWDVNAADTVLRTSGRGDDRSIFTMDWNKCLSRYLVAGQGNGSLQFIDIRADKIDPTIPNCHEGGVKKARWNEEGTYLASADSNEIFFWDQRYNGHNYNGSKIWAGEIEFSVNCHKALEWCPFQRNLLVTGGGEGDCTISLCNVTTGKLMSGVALDADAFNLVVSPHQPEICCSIGRCRTDESLTNTLQLFKYRDDDLGIVQRKGIETNYQEPIADLVLNTGNGTDVAAISVDGTVKLWSLFDSQRSTSVFKNDLSLPPKVFPNPDDMWNLGLPSFSPTIR
jgi:cell division cycle protein 20 (cofactor of APC complex)